MEAESAKNGSFREIFTVFFKLAKGEKVSDDLSKRAIIAVLEEDAIIAAAGRVAISTDVVNSYQELIEVGTRFIESVGKMD